MTFNPFNNGNGGGTSEDTVARAEIAAIKDGETLDSFGDVENALADKANIIDIPTTAADVSALPDTTKYAATLSLTINSSTFIITGQLKDQDGNNLGTAQTIDLPLESVVVGGSYDDTTKKVILTLQNGNTVEFSVADLVSGLQTELSASNKLNPAYINYDSTHAAVTEAQREQIGTNTAILSQTYNSADCNVSVFLRQDNGAIDESTYYNTSESKMHFRMHWSKNQLVYWNVEDEVYTNKYRYEYFGVIATNNVNKSTWLTIDIPEVANETYIKKTTTTDTTNLPNVDQGGYTWNKASVNVGDIWYIRPYVVMTDLQFGNQFIKYGAVYKVTAGVPCTIECDTLSCTELTKAIGDINTVLEGVL